MTAGDTVTVGYLGSAMHPLADASGTVRSAPWFDLAVENVTGTETPVAAPDAEQRPDDPLAAAADGTRVLDASGLGLTDLAGVARLAALTRLDLSGNAVADLAPLAGLTALRDLDLADNLVADLGPLSALHGLERLDLSGNAGDGPLAAGRTAAPGGAGAGRQRGGGPRPADASGPARAAGPRRQRGRGRDAAAGSPDAAAPGSVR